MLKMQFSIPFCIQHRKKYADSEYGLSVDPIQGDKAREIKLRSFAKPHMRAFHMSWMGLFCAVFLWYSMAPLLPEIRKDLHLTTRQIWKTSIAGVGGTVLIRILLGPLCDKFGPRIAFSFVLCLASIQVACTGMVQTYNDLMALRCFVSIAGGCFVTSQYWTSTMFCKSLAGTANAMVAGWGNLGGGAAQLIMGSALFPFFKIVLGDSEQAWRCVFVIPAVLSFGVGIIIYCITDDCPKGNYGEIKRHGAMTDISFAGRFRRATMDHNTWILFLQYGCCYGVELTMNNAAALYFTDEFGQSTESAAAIASIYGWMNLFSRGMGGFISDWASATMGMKGRLWAQLLFLMAEAVFIIYFGKTKTLTGSIVVMIFLAICSQGAQGSTYGIVPQIDPPTTGAISGLVGAGGPFGAVLFGVSFLHLDYNHSFTVMGFCVFGAAALTALVKIRGCSGLFAGADYVWDIAPSVFVVIP
jgi:NNP family nitrate/nitrite transporter-like MFS transporter